MNSYEFTLSLRIYHPYMKCDEIADAVRMTPRIRQDNGSLRQTPKGIMLEGVYEKTYCSFELEKKNLGSIEQALQKWTLIFKDKACFFKKINESGGRTEFFIGIFLSGNSGVEFSAENLKSIADSNIDIALDLYC